MCHWFGAVNSVHTQTQTHSSGGVSGEKSLVSPTESPTDRLGVQGGEETRERIRPHVPHGHDVSDHHWPHSGQGQVGHTWTRWHLNIICLKFVHLQTFQEDKIHCKMENLLSTHDWHCWLSTSPVNLSVLRCIKLALVHDMAECIVGDIAPSDNVSKAEKHRREEARDEQRSHYN